MAGLILLPLIISLLSAIFLIIIPMWKIFTKAGKPGWACIIPIYNIIVMLEVVKKPVWWIILMLIPIVNIVIAIIVIHQLSLSFGKGTGFTVGLILLPVIFLPILGYGSSQYQLEKE